MTLCLGKTPARPEAITFKLRKYLNLSVLPAPPDEFGHDGLVTNWGMLANDRFGCCVWSGAAHETLLWNKEAGVDVSFSDDNVLSDYSAVTGFDPNNAATDQGTDMQQAASYRRNTGIVDASGKRHTVLAYLAIKSGDVEEHLAAAYVFGAVGIGLTFPQSAMDQFDAGQPWSPVENSPIVGGHYVPMLARRGGLWVVSTWGAEQRMDDDFFAANNDESVVYLSAEMLSNNTSIDGFDLEQLQADLAALPPAA